ncbi:hypothetical protein [Maribacter sp. 2-571]|uniref:hypothetical protein n=1 Tax=Maribacter sp. 2-571 TaxID=3417569 RepID=UPI003D33443A
MYKSPVDLLGIDPEDIAALDDKAIIRLEKKLRAQRAQGTAEGYNPQQNETLLAQLRDKEAQKALYFIEKHPNLKAFISTGEDASVKTFSIDKELLEATPGLNVFLAPYLESFMMQLIKKDFAKKKYDTIIRAMEQKTLFTDSFLDTYYRYVMNQLSIIIETIKVTPTGKLCEKLPELTYITFVQLLNTVPLGLIRSDKIAYINTMVDYYNAGKNKHKEFPKVKRIFGNMRQLYFDDFEMKRFVKKLAAQITSVDTVYAESDSGSGSSSKSIWGIIVAVILVVRFISLAARLSDDDSATYQQSPIVVDQSKSIVNSLKNSMDKDGNKSKFFQGISEMSQDEAFLPISFLGMNDGANPYPIYFNAFVEDSIHDSKVSFENNSDNVVILFALNKGKNQKRAGYYLVNSNAELGLSVGDSLVFYTGDYFGAIPDQRAVMEMIKKRPTRFFKYTNAEQRKLSSEYYLITDSDKDAKIEMTENGPVFDGLKPVRMTMAQEEVVPDLDI